MDPKPSTSKAAAEKNVSLEKKRKWNNNGAKYNRGWQNRHNNGPNKKPTTMSIPELCNSIPAQNIIIPPNSSDEYRGWKLYFPTKGKLEPAKFNSLLIFQ